MLKKYFFIILYFLSPLIPITVVYNSNPVKYSNFSFAGPMILGEIAYTWLIFEFILSARPKFAEKYFGMDKFYRFHGLMAVISLVIVYFHRTYIGRGYRASDIRRFGNYAFNIYIVIVIITLVLMVNSFVLKIKPIFWIKKIVEKLRIFKYEHFVLIHNLMVIALICMFIHVMLTSSARKSLAVQMVYIVYFAVGAMFYVYHKLIRRIILLKKMFVVKEVIKESQNMWTIKLTPEKGNIFPYKPGQFGFMRMYGGEIRSEEHPFSISSEPSNKSYLSITIKELGDFTSTVKNIQAGYIAQLDAPYGRFSYLNNPNEEGTVLIAGGVGITPALSMLRYMHKMDKEHLVVLFWGVNDRSELICADEFEEMKKDMKNFHFIPVMFRDETWEGEKGIIDKKRIGEILKKQGLNIRSLGFYICGPAIMLDSAIASLKALGAKRKSIHFEKFSL